MAIIKPYLGSVRFASTIGVGTGTGATFAIAATTFTDDTGVTATAFPGSFAYYNLYINGALQLGDTSTVTTSALTIPGGDVLNGNIPVLVEFVVA